MRYTVGLVLEFRWLQNQQRFGRTARITRVEGLLYDLESENGRKWQWAAYEITRAMKPRMHVTKPTTALRRDRRYGVGRRVVRPGIRTGYGMVIESHEKWVRVRWSDDQVTVEKHEDLFRAPK